MKEGCGLYHMFQRVYSVLGTMVTSSGSLAVSHLLDTRVVEVNTGLYVNQALPTADRLSRHGRSVSGDCTCGELSAE
jgi:streptogramin lyase